MTPELSLLAWSVALMFVQVLIAAGTANNLIGLTTLVGNREDLPPITGLAGRARRAHLNMLENLPLFIALVLVAHAAGRENGMTLLGAHLFFWARLAHAIIYLIGIPYLRTLAWTVSAIGLVLIFIQVV